MKSVYVYAIICVVLILIGVGGYHFFTKGKAEPGESGEPETIVIGGGEKQTSGTENYMSMPDTAEVPVSVSEYTVIAYDPESTSLDTASSWEEKEECPGGGYDCLYIERVNENGRVTAITDKDGNDFLQKFTDDLYNGKLKWIDEAIQNPTNLARMSQRYKLSDDNQLMFKVDDKWVRVEPGANKEYQLKDGGMLTQDMTVTKYLINLMVLYKASGKPKPNIVIDLPALKRQVIGLGVRPSYGPEDPRHPDHPSNKNVQRIPDSERKEKRSYKK